MLSFRSASNPSTGLHNPPPLNRRAISKSWTSIAGFFNKLRPSQRPERGGTLRSFPPSSDSHRLEDPDRLPVVEDARYKQREEETKCRIASAEVKTDDEKRKKNISRTLDQQPSGTSRDEAPPAKSDNVTTSRMGSQESRSRRSSVRRSSIQRKPVNARWPDAICVPNRSGRVTDGSLGPRPWQPKSPSHEHQGVRTRRTVSQTPDVSISSPMSPSDAPATEPSSIASAPAAPTSPVSDLSSPSARAYLEAKRQARRQRRSLRESGDFLGVTGVNPETGEPDIITPPTSSSSVITTSSLSSSDSETAVGTSKKEKPVRTLAEMGMAALGLKPKSRETRSAEKEERRWRREQARILRAEKRKEAMREVLQEQGIKWRRVKGEWSSIPAGGTSTLTPIPGSLPESRRPSGGQQHSRRQSAATRPTETSFLGLAAVARVVERRGRHRRRRRYFSEQETQMTTFIQYQQREGLSPTTTEQEVWEEEEERVSRRLSLRVLSPLHCVWPSLRQRDIQRAQMMQRQDSKGGEIEHQWMAGNMRDWSLMPEGNSLASVQACQWAENMLEDLERLERLSQSNDTDTIIRTSSPTIENLGDDPDRIDPDPDPDPFACTPTIITTGFEQPNSPPPPPPPPPHYPAEDSPPFDGSRDGSLPSSSSALTPTKVKTRAVSMPADVMLSPQDRGENYSHLSWTGVYTRACSDSRPGFLQDKKRSVSRRLVTQDLERMLKELEVMQVKERAGEKEESMIVHGGGSRVCTPILGVGQEGKGTRQSGGMLLRAIPWRKRGKGQDGRRQEEKKKKEKGKVEKKKAKKRKADKEKQAHQTKSRPAEKLKPQAPEQPKEWVMQKTTMRQQPPPISRTAISLPFKAPKGTSPTSISTSPPRHTFSAMAVPSVAAQVDRGLARDAARAAFAQKPGLTQGAGQETQVKAAAAKTKEEEKAKEKDKFKAKEAPKKEEGKQKGDNGERKKNEGEKVKGGKTLNEKGNKEQDGDKGREEEQEQGEGEEQEEEQEDKPKDKEPKNQNQAQQKQQQHKPKGKGKLHPKQSFSNPPPEPTADPPATLTQIFVHFTYSTLLFLGHLTLQTYSLLQPVFDPHSDLRKRLDSGQGHLTW
ncbi:uncharacterized protein CTHT_0030350 [Thermochaetoides thermophila DSM 1495]|uniref:Uncharacterized protein n=1 Tax=Chaetomium thermophilum (strain DSM 1495 / CBS 144.50 / IMI 039719) TaxID=759272 RepID=G0S3R5_CHATD|nr:hypothetical protein CTHT_0030350 [Thermochaetoides thermophila DSM 1495]EGS21191.1 hypothetical protein CTHT_0030350 [Thermochaetoides thermophila DSM 1495]